MIVISNEEFLWRTGINLEAKLEGQDVSVEDMSKIHRTRWSEYVYDVVKSSSTRPVIEDAKLTDLQIETIKSCEADMGIFIFQYGDPKANGYYEGEETTAWLQGNSSNSTIISDGSGLVPKRNVYLAYPTVIQILLHILV